MADGQTWAIPADKQAAFDRVWWHLRAQRKRALRGAYCAYRSPDGSKCAIGIFIPAGHSAEHSSATLSILRGLYPDLFEPGVDINFLSALQAAHDHADEDAPKFRRALERVAKRWRLTTPLQRGEKAPTP